MQRCRDERAVSNLVGTVFLFGFLVILFSTWQATVVPAANKQTEFNAFLDLTADITDLRNALLSTALDGTPVGTTVKTSAQYQPRVLFVNPSPPNGQLRTTPPQNITYTHVQAVNPDSADYWNGDSRNFSTQSIVFEPGYNKLNVAPLVITPTGFTYRDADTTVPLTSQVLIQENQLTAIALTGDVSGSGGLTTAVTTEPISPHTRTIAVTGENNQNIIITVPTTLAATTWETRLLKNQPHVVTVQQNGTNQVDIVLDGAVTYELRMAAVSIHEQHHATTTTTTPRYVVTASESNTVTTTNQPVDVIAEVRDKFNNPTANGTVTFRITSGESRAQFRRTGTNSVTVRSDEAGKAQAVVVPEAPGRLTVTATLDNGTHLAKQVTYHVDIRLAGGGTYRYPYSFTDGDSNMSEAGENQSLPPTNPRGNIEQFQRLREDDNQAAQLIEEAISVNPVSNSYDLRVGVAVDDIPAASTHSLTISYEFLRSVEDTTIEFTTADGTVLDTVQLQQESQTQANETFTLSDDATAYLNQKGVIYTTIALKDESGGDEQSTLAVYQLRVEST